MLGVIKRGKSEQIRNKKSCHKTNSWEPQLKDSARFGSLYLKDMPAEVQKVQSRGVRLAVSWQSFWVSRTGSSRLEVGQLRMLQNNGGLERVERGKPSHPTEEESDERNRCKTQNHKTEAFFTQCVIRLQQLLLQDAVVAKI